MRAIILILCFAVLGKASDAEPPAHNVSDADLKAARFFAGAALLRSTTHLSGADRLARFRKLEETSGLTAAAAAEFLNECRGDPERLKNVNELALSILTDISKKPTPEKIAGASVEKEKGDL